MPRVRYALMHKNISSSSVRLHDATSLTTMNECASDVLISGHWISTHRAIPRYLPSTQASVVDTSLTGLEEFFPSKGLKILIRSAPQKMCPDCGRGYYYYMKLHSHMRRVHNYELPPSRRQCQIRGSNRQLPHSSSVDLDEHQEVQEQGGTELRDADCRCPACQEIFLVDFLPGHIKDSHKRTTFQTFPVADFPAELCYFCDTSFPSAELTQQHIQSHHLTLLVGRSTGLLNSIRGSLNADWLFRLRDTMYKCDHCERVFVWKKYLRQHIRQEHPSGGTVFSMRNNFHSERTSLTVVCDKQQQDLLDLAVFPDEKHIVPSLRSTSATSKRNTTNYQEDLHDQTASTLSSGLASIIMLSRLAISISQFLYDFLALIDSKSQVEEAKALESSVEQVSSISIALMDSSGIEDRLPFVLNTETEVKPEEPKQQQEEHEEDPKDPLINVKQESPTSNGENDYVSVQP
ncbi:hypothetical protein ACTXT7_008365 [Hymenolepis weldensis]